jgi:hypothetical protein
MPLNYLTPISRAQAESLANAALTATYTDTIALATPTDNMAPKHDEHESGLFSAATLLHLLGGLLLTFALVTALEPQYLLLATVPLTIAALLCSVVPYTGFYKEIMDASTYRCRHCGCEHPSGRLTSV